MEYPFSVESRSDWLVASAQPNQVPICLSFPMKKGHILLMNARYKPLNQDQLYSLACCLVSKLGPKFLKKTSPFVRNNDFGYP